PPETDRAEEFAERFPGWAGLVGAQAARIVALERTVEALTDRLTHDPFLSESLHDVLSVVTAIRSTAGILASGDPVDPEWQTRFHRNLYEDSQRLAKSSQALVAYLDEEIEAAGTGSNAAPQDEVEAWLSGTGFHLAELEGAGAQARMAKLLDAAQALSSAPARQLAQSWMTRYARDARRMPLAEIEALLASHGPDPAQVARHFGVSLPAAMRRMGALPPRDGDGARFGVVICDGSGTLTFREPLAGFALPRFGAACPLWPLYQALVRPGTPVRAVVEMPGSAGLRFTCYAYCHTRGVHDFALPPVLEATMLIADGGPETEAATPIGSSCRICPRDGCPARREPSILAEGL
ncbi:short-chain fatty acyl-CoA regulator family protein, partial [Aliiroseovarius sp. PTFE2010]|uniref:short-chain fatty acyl-CoA regulator family protein n=1 Tax=Aliiroseovarius sp. PTFE2010 TaxID=3417190 RepID=UPI003CFB9D59